MITFPRLHFPPGAVRLARAGLVAFCLLGVVYSEAGRWAAPSPALAVVPHEIMVSEAIYHGIAYRSLEAVYIALKRPAQAARVRASTPASPGNRRESPRR